MKLLDLFRHKPNLSVLEVHTFLRARHLRDGQVLSEQEIQDKCITNAFVTALAAALAGNTSVGTLWYHASGTGSLAEAATDTTLVAEVEARDIGTHTSAVGLFTSVATHTYAGIFDIFEHGLFTAAAAGTLADRTVLGGSIHVVAGDKIEWTFTMTFASGG